MANATSLILMMQIIFCSGFIYHLNVLGCTTCIFWRFIKDWTNSPGRLVGVLATSWILTADSQKLSFSILRKVPFLIFWSDKPPLRANSAHVACSRAGTWAAWAELARRGAWSYHNNIDVFEILVKNCSKYVSASIICWNFS